mmetsp:Transcript_2052/g.2914  ORF Transcript_2052/g.2914 Transcript_2052/m.2914 type:complete len:204 (-) Transcript_2052:175-786(-)|eukprot:CAMPEP_0201545448 /NCGR_PEP_ID=MMETSP0173_2-20130828/1973_1 /ASSEMBLY_ACC=CAM_ASM_000268 /TAXON_ID=218659 /ORGANISM="Vexillifera sp., Strain DIVA3 564/2" /LENGTH=203 /DNA_ID=CAMNT_0047953855 /DNA_START=35 /DNA_END=646 /DNA_ORIENTATION=+
MSGDDDAQLDTQELLKKLNNILERYKSEKVNGIKLDFSSIDLEDPETVTRALYDQNEDIFQKNARDVVLVEKNLIIDEQSNIDLHGTGKSLEYTYNSDNYIIVRFNIANCEKSVNFEKLYPNARTRDSWKSITHKLKDHYSLKIAVNVNPTRFKYTVLNVKLQKNHDKENFEINFAFHKNSLNQDPNVKKYEEYSYELPIKAT